MVAYFGRCLIIISKDKIASYHIWKMVLQSFLCELGGEWQRRGERERLQHEDTKRCREWNLRDHLRRNSRLMDTRLLFYYLLLGEAFSVLGPNCELSERVNESSLNRKGCRKFWTIFVAIDMTRFEYQSECKFPKLPQSKKCAERHLCHVSNTISSDKIWHLTLTRPKTLML